MAKKILCALLVSVMLFALAVTALPNTANAASSGVVYKAQPGEIVIDGRYELGYGTAPITTVRWTESDPDSVFWIRDPRREGVDYGTVKEDVYMAYDQNYLYYYAVVENWDWTNKDTVLKIKVGQYNADSNSVNRFEWQSNWYERFTFFTIGKDASGNYYSSFDQSGGGSATLVAGTDYVIREDGSKMYYEVRMPWSGGLPDITDNKMVISSSLCLSKYAEEYGSNLLWYTAADGMSGTMLNNSAILNLSGDAAPGLTEVAVKKLGNEITMDGNVTAYEWGDPVFTGTGWQADASTGYESWLYDNAVSAVNFDNVSYKVYLCYDEDYLYVGAKLSNWNWTNTDTMVRYLVSPFVAGTTVERFVYDGSTYERLCILQYDADVDDNTHTCTDDSVGLDTSYAPEWAKDYCFNWQQGNTMNYEVRIPWSEVNPTLTNPAAGSKFAFSSALQVSDYKSDDLPGDIYMWNRGAMEGKNDIIGNKAVVLVLSDSALPTGGEKDQAPAVQYDDDALPIFPLSGVTIDGKLDTDEWGDPLFTLTREFAWKNTDKGFDYWDQKPLETSNGRMSMYYGYDGNYLYGAVKLTDVDFETYAATVEDKWNHQGLHLAIGQWDDETTVKRITYMDQVYEQFSQFNWYPLDEDNLYLEHGTQGIASQAELSKQAGNAAVTYDAATRTLIYEYRIPWWDTPLGNNGIKAAPGAEIALTSYVRLPQATGSEDGTGDSYQWYQGCNHRWGAGNFDLYQKAAKVVLADKDFEYTPFTPETGVRNIAAYSVGAVMLLAMGALLFLAFRKKVYADK